MSSEKELKKMFGGKLSQREREPFLGKPIKKKPKRKPKRISAMEFSLDVALKRAKRSK